MEDPQMTQSPYPSHKVEISYDGVRSMWIGIFGIVLDLELGVWNL